MSVVKEVRIRPVNANIDERLGSTTQKSPGLFSGLKGGLSDVKITVEDDGNKWIGTFLPIADANAAFEQTFRKKDFSWYTAENIVYEMMKIGATKKLSVSGNTKTKPEDYYEVVQDPYQDNPPKRRSFGNDPYYLNNGAKISIFWMIGDKLSVPRGPEFTPGINLVGADWGSWVGGTIWSDNEGNELPGTPARDKNNEIIPDTWIGKMTDGVWLNPSKSGELENYTTDQIKKYVLVESPSLVSDQPYESFTVTDENIVDFQKTEKDPKIINEWAPSLHFINRDKSIISAIIEVWNKKVPEYGKTIDTTKVLRLCNPDFYPTVEMKYVSPFDLTNTISGTGSSQSQNVIEEKFQLNVKLPEVLDIKAGVDMPLFSVYVGDIPEIDPDNIFTDEIETFIQEDDEFTESDFIGEQEASEQIDPFKAKEDAAVLEQVESAASSGAGIELPDKTIERGSWDLVPIPGDFSVNKGGGRIKCVVIDGAIVNMSFAAAYLDMQAAAKKEGIDISINSGFRSPYDSIKTSAKSGYKDGKKVSNPVANASSQQYLYNQYLCCGGNLAAKPGESPHGNGIALDINVGGKSKGRYINVNEKKYEWMVKNSWRFGFVRTVANEEWHFDYRPDIAAKGPYAKLPAKDTGAVTTKFYNKKKDGSYWGLDEIKI